jgi:hypothetical protein
MFIDKIKEHYEVKADTGDVPMYFNISDFFKPIEGDTIKGRQIEIGTQILRKAIEPFYGSFIKDILSEMKKEPSWGKQLQANGLMLK